MRPLLLALLATLLLPSARALEIPGSASWAELIIGQVDANGDTSIDGAEWSDGLARGFESRPGGSTGHRLFGEQESDRLAVD